MSQLPQFQVIPNATQPKKIIYDSFEDGKQPSQDEMVRTCIALGANADDPYETFLAGYYQYYYARNHFQFNHDELQRLQIETSNLKKQNEEWSQLYNKRNEEYNQMMQYFNNAENTPAILKELETLRAEHSNCETTIQNLKNQIEILNDRITTLSRVESEYKQIYEMKYSADQIKYMLEQNKQAAKTDQGYVEMQNTIEQLSRMNEQLMAEVKQLKAMNSDYERMYNSKHDVDTAEFTHQQRIQTLQSNQSLAELQNKIHQLEMTNQQLNAKIASMEAIAQHTVTKHQNELQSKDLTVQERIAAAESDLSKKYNDSIKSTTDTIANQSQQLADQTLLIGKLNTYIANLEAINVHLETKHQADLNDLKNKQTLELFKQANSLTAFKRAAYDLITSILSKYDDLYGYVASSFLIVQNIVRTCVELLHVPPEAFNGLNVIPDYTQYWIDKYGILNSVANDIMSTDPANDSRFNKLLSQEVPKLDKP